jgi:hypothetical protein
MKVVYRIMGANPQDLDNLPSFDAQIAAFNEGYAKFGFPQNLSITDRALLTADIPILYQASFGMQAVVGQQNLTHFQQTLLSMWTALGLEPAEIDRPASF